MIVLNFIVWLSAITLWLVLAYCAMTYVENIRIIKWIKRNCEMNTLTEMVVILPGVDWRRLRAWFKPNFCLSEIKAVFDFARTRGKACAFYINPDFDAVEHIMAEKSVREVCFVGHGGAHYFKLNTIDTLCYCAFADGKKYGKERVHQIHCGVPYGKRLIDYVVPEPNRSRCFFSPGEIDGHFIEDELKRLGNLAD